MQVTGLSLKFMRRIQLREYEPAEVEFTLHAMLEDDESHLEAGKQLATDARDMIKSAFEGLTKGKETTKKKGRPKKTQAETVTPPVADAGPPVADAGPPVNGPTSEEQQDTIDLPSLQAYISDIVTKKKKLRADQIKDVLKSFGATRTLDLKREDVPRVKEALDLLLSEGV